MDSYITGGVIKQLREQKKLTQAELAALLGVSDKAVSKWETGRGLPDIALVEPLGRALNVSMMELLSGRQVTNQNKAGNFLRSNFYVCPVCGNVVYTIGKALVSCCGITLPPLEPERPDEAHSIQCERIEDEYFVSVPHSMTKQHYLSFFAYITSDRLEMKKLYAEGNAEARFFIRGKGILYCYCNQHGLFQCGI
ncbi:MAG: helix-turn-helix domain-containing protein [Oscillospiraceae bacterium]|nr:helix-turn-helix domain-containing protein [Oscillospiraceae bacterium]